MRNLHKPDNADIDRLISGMAPSDGSGDSLALLVHRMRRIAEIPLSEATEQRHLTAILQEAHLLVEKGDPVARPVSKADGPDFQDSLLPKRRRKFMIGSVLSSVTAKLAASGIAVALATTGGLAAAGELPDPVQEKVAQVADQVGIELPDGDDVDLEGDLEGDVEITDPAGGNGKRSNFDVHEAMQTTNTATSRGQIISEAARQKPDGTTTGGGVSDEVHAAIDATEPGPDRGKAVSEAASGKPHNAGGDDGGSDDELDDELESTEQNVGKGPGSHGRGNSNKNKP